MTLLSLSNVSAHYGTSQALFDVSLTIAEGECLAVMGRNGMGKSTTVKTICRIQPTSGGEIVFNGEKTTGLAAHRVARMGVGLVPEGRRCFANLSVYENLIVAARDGSFDLNWVYNLFPRLEERQTQSAATLSGGEQQMLAIGRALMTNPKLLILDEATEGLAPVVRQEIWQAIATLKSETGLSILVIDKSIKELSTVADNVVIIERGKSVWTDKIANLTPEIQHQYLGV